MLIHLRTNSNDGLQVSVYVIFHVFLKMNRGSFLVTLLDTSLDLAGQIQRPTPSVRNDCAAPVLFRQGL